MKQGRYEEAETALVKALELNTQWRGTQYIALDKFRLAEVYANTGRLRLACIYAQEACDLYERLGMIERHAAAERLIQDLRCTSLTASHGSPIGDPT